MAVSPTSSNGKVAVYVLVILFGIASWVDINGLWVELPILVHALPEGWNLPSYIIIVCQFANIGPLLYTLASLHCPHRLSEKWTIYGILTVGATAVTLLVFYWHRTSLIGGVPHSTALLALNFFLAFVDTTSSVAFLPFMVVFKPVYMTAYFIGEGFSGLIPGLLGLAQGAGRAECLNTTLVLSVNETSNTTLYSTQLIYVENNFSIEVFFIFIAGMICVSGIAFTFLKYHPYCKREYVYVYVNMALDSKNVVVKNALIEMVDDGLYIANDEHCSEHVQEHSEDINVDEACSYSLENNRSKMSRNEYIVTLALTGWISSLSNAVLVSVQSYSCLPYGTEPYHLTVTLASLANPLSCFVLFFFYVNSIRVLSVVSLIGSLLGVYIMAAAAMSPTPVFVGTATGSVMIVSAWVLCVFTLTYAKVAIAGLLRLEGKTALLYCGAVSQFGSFLGGIVMFLLVNVFHLFVVIPTCPQK